MELINLVKTSLNKLTLAFPYNYYSNSFLSGDKYMILQISSISGHKLCKFKRTDSFWKVSVATQLFRKDLDEAWKRKSVFYRGLNNILLLTFHSNCSETDKWLKDYRKALTILIRVKSLFSFIFHIIHDPKLK